MEAKRAKCSLKLGDCETKNPGQCVWLIGSGCRNAHGLAVRRHKNAQPGNSSARSRKAPRKAPRRHVGTGNSSGRFKKAPRGHVGTGNTVVRARRAEHGTREEKSRVIKMYLQIFAKEKSAWQSDSQNIVPFLVFLKKLVHCARSSVTMTGELLNFHENNVPLGEAIETQYNRLHQLEKKMRSAPYEEYLEKLIRCVEKAINKKKRETAELDAHPFDTNGVEHNVSNDGKGEPSKANPTRGTWPNTYTPSGSESEEVVEEVIEEGYWNGQEETPKARKTPGSVRRVVDVGVEEAARKEQERLSRERNEQRVRAANEALDADIVATLGEDWDKWDY